VGDLPETRFSCFPVVALLFRCFSPYDDPVSTERKPIKGLHDATLKLVDASIFAQSLGHLIARARKRAGLTQTDLARKLRVSRNTVGKMEVGAQGINFYTLFEICAATDAKLTDLVPPEMANFLPKAEIDQRTLDRLNAVLRDHEEAPERSR
jgi:transcriptional regulator with XRE-family HTH domain